LLLEDLVEQEKREQARHTGTNQMDQILPNLGQQSMLNDQVLLFIIFHPASFLQYLFFTLGLRKTSS
jgi:hypothetical protein